MAKLDADKVFETLTQTSDIPPENENEELLLDGERESGGVFAGVIEAPGVIKDPHSDKIWTLPSGSLADSGFATYRSPRDIKKDPNFHYEFHTVKELPEYVSQGFVPVTRRELGLEDFTSPASQPSPLDSYYTIDGEDICIKIPRQIADLRYASNKSICDAALEGVTNGVITSRNAEGDLVRSRDHMAVGGEQAGPVERRISQKTNRHEPTRDELN
jgi:hypothetical protein